MFDNPVLFFVCGLGVFNGFLVALYFLFFNRERRVQNFIFGLLVLFLSMRIGKSLYVIFTPKEDRNITLIQIGLSACFLIGVSLYYYIKSSLENKKEIPVKWKLNFAFMTTIMVVLGLVFPYENSRGLWNSYIVYIIYFVWGIYILAAGYVLRNTIQKLIAKSKECTTSEIWLIWVYAANLLIFIAYLIGMFYLYLVGTITFSIVFYVLLIFFMSKKNREVIFKELPEKYASKKIIDTEAELLLKKLNELISTKVLYKNTSIKISHVAKEIGITPHKLSQLLNDNLGKSFTAFMNEYRIEEAKKLLQERKELTLEAIGFEAGFSSKSNFYATFKKVVGQTPSQFQQQFL